MGNLLIDTLCPEKIFLGTNNVQKIMCGEEQCWPPRTPWDGGVTLSYLYAYEVISQTYNNCRWSWWYIPGSNLQDAWDRYDATGMDTVIQVTLPIDDCKVISSGYKPYQLKLVIAPRRAGDRPPYSGYWDPIPYDEMYLRLTVANLEFSGTRWDTPETSGWTVIDRWMDPPMGQDVNFEVRHTTWTLDREFTYQEGHVKQTHGSPYIEGEFKVLDGYVPSTFWEEILARDPNGTIACKYNSCKTASLTSIAYFTMKQLAVLAPYGKELTGAQVRSDGTVTKYRIQPKMDGTITITYYSEDIYPYPTVTREITPLMIIMSTSTRPYLQVDCCF